ncbi:TnsA endonuclease N-terminal domain-containing protein [Cohnella terricola]|uniref:TnsA endonuclease N-terminal domain-containing protein n=1 Tax=Cohnella terricola TaxID=1289167 RepID=A0A559JQL0_9BACL|nr:TnsA endonuclease N-terminal domain-containing protein [Cohnella terricola]TVY02164.1 hypothetical protein FPZ45_06900 [Cohnella terricola]
MDIRYEPIVMPRSKKYGNNYWSAKGPKVGMREVVLYSDLEFDHWLLVETNPHVKIYCEQPLEISFVWEEKLHSSIFDMWICYEDNSQYFIEVKYESELQPHHRNIQRTTRQINAQSQWCQENGFGYSVITDKTIRNSFINLENRLKVLSEIRGRERPFFLDKVLKQITKKKQTIETLFVNHFHDMSVSDVLRACFWLFYEGKIESNINNVIWSTQSEVNRI